MSLRFLPWAPPCSSFFHYSDVYLLIILLPGGSRIITVVKVVYTTFWDTRVNRDLYRP